MKSRTTKEFWKLHNTLPTSVQVQAKVVYLRWQKDPFHTSLDFKRISRKLPVYSIRIGRSWRALGQRKGIPSPGFGSAPTRPTIRFSMNSER